MALGSYISPYDGKVHDLEEAWTRLQKTSPKYISRLKNDPNRFLQQYLDKGWKPAGAAPPTAKPPVPGGGTTPPGTSTPPTVPPPGSGAGATSTPATASAKPNTGGGPLMGLAAGGGESSSGSFEPSFGPGLRAGLGQRAHPMRNTALAALQKLY